MKNGTREDYQLLAELEKPFLSLTADRVLTNYVKQEMPLLRDIRLHVSSMAYNQALVQCVMERYRLDCRSSSS